MTTPITQTKMLNILANPRALKVLLEGGPNANKHQIDPQNAAKWVDAQLGNGVKLSCQSLLKTVTYINHETLIATTRQLVRKFSSRIGNKKYRLITERSTKSGFFMTLLFLYFLRETSVYKNLLSITNDIPYAKIDEDVPLVFVNDMDYTSNQALRSYSTIQQDYSKYCFTKHKLPIEYEKLIYATFRRPTHINNINKHISSLPVSKTKREFIKKQIVNIIKTSSGRKQRDNVEQFLHDTVFDMPRLNIMNVRCYQSKVAVNAIKEYTTYRNVKRNSKRGVMINRDLNKFMKFSNLSATVLPSVTDKLQAAYPKSWKHRSKLIARYWCPFDDVAVQTYDLCSETNVYFDHKIADSSSTYMIPLITGLVLTYKGKSPKTRVVALIDKCSYGEELRTLLKRLNYDFDEIYGHFGWYELHEMRCPYTWYKRVNWSTGRISKKGIREV
jgi:hypothetical protein